MSDSQFIFCGNGGIIGNDPIDPFSGNILYATWGCFDIQGSCIVPIEYDRIITIDKYISAGKGHGLTRGQNGFLEGFSGKWTLFSREGHIIIDDYNEIHLQDELFIVRRNVKYRTYREEYNWIDFEAMGGHYCIYDISGKLLIDNIKEVRHIDYDYAIITNHNGKSGLINVYSPNWDNVIYDSISFKYGVTLLEEYIVARKEGKYGLLTKTGDILVPPQYDDITEFERNHGIKHTGDRCWVINNTENGYSNDDYSCYDGFTKDEVDSGLADAFENDYDAYLSRQ